MTYESTRKLYEDAGQGHLFQFWSSLSSSEQSNLLTQLDSINIKRVNHIHAKALEVEKGASDGTSPEIIEPLPEDASSSTRDPAAESQWKQLGLRAIAEGEVGVLLMAGGQGTRLGSSTPKGCYDIGLPSHKSLFQYQAERIARLQTVAETEFGKAKGSVIIPWYVMTSGPTRPETEKFFAENSYFGLNPSSVIFFEQGS
jgi:UDP-N-acetylglucosamine/UDP-N-acetylgalactosamine diphosphorylase